MGQSMRSGIAVAAIGMFTLLVLAVPVRASEPGAVAAVQAQGVTQPGTKVQAGRAEVIYDAPVDQVSAVVRDYGAYTEFLPHFEQSRVLSRKGAKALVHMQAKLARNTITVWARMHMQARAERDGRQVVEARMVKGNVKHMAARWELTPLEDGRTRVVFEMLLQPKLPLPAGLVSKENISASEETLLALQERLTGGAVARAPE